MLATDRLGFRPLYYVETADWFAYAAEVKALLALHDHLPAVDEIAVRQYFAFDHMLGDRTWWTGIALIPPANVWRVSRGVVTRSGGCVTGLRRRAGPRTIGGGGSEPECHMARPGCHRMRHPASLRPS